MRAVGLWKARGYTDKIDKYLRGQDIPTLDGTLEPDPKKAKPSFPDWDEDMEFDILPGNIRINTQVKQIQREQKDFDLTQGMNVTIPQMRTASSTNSEEETGNVTALYCGKCHATLQNNMANFCEYFGNQIRDPKAKQLLGAQKIMTSTINFSQAITAQHQTEYDERRAQMQRAEDYMKDQAEYAI